MELPTDDEAMDNVDLFNSMIKGSIIPANKIREKLGLPRLPFVPAQYHIEGVTDLSVLIKQAVKQRDAGKSNWIHLHKVGDPCQKGCTLYYKNGEEELDGGREMGSGDE